MNITNKTTLLDIYKETRLNDNDDIEALDTLREELVEAYKQKSILLSMSDEEIVASCNQYNKVESQKFYSDINSYKEHNQICLDKISKVKKWSPDAIDEHTKWEMLNYLQNSFIEIGCEEYTQLSPKEWFIDQLSWYNSIIESRTWTIKLIEDSMNQFETQCSRLAQIFDKLEKY